MLLGDPRRLRGLWVSSFWTQLLTCPLLCMSGEVPQVQFLDNGDIPFELCLPSRVWLGNEFGFRRPSLEREVLLDVRVHCSVAEVFVVSFTVP